MHFNLTVSMQVLLKGPTLTEIALAILQQKKPSTKSNKWFFNVKQNSNARLRLFCFPYGGGGASLYYDWQDYLPEHIEVCPIQLPGRENRMDEVSIHNMSLLINNIVEHLQSKLDLPFAFFGHSFGALIAFELTRYLRRHNLPQPVSLFISAFPDPHHPTTHLDTLLMQLSVNNINLSEVTNSLSEDQLNRLISIFQNYGILDEKHFVLNKNMIKLLLPTFIGDVNIVKNYTYYEEPPLDIPLTLFVGKQDNWVSPDDYFKWAEQTTQKFELVEFDGGHLFVKDLAIKQHMLAVIKNTLMTASQTVKEP